MRKLALVLLVIPFISWGQLKSGSGIKMITEYGLENSELQDILTFSGIDYYKVKFVGNELKKRHFSIVTKEIWDGKITKVDTIINTAKMEGMPSISSDTLRFRVVAKKFTSNKLKVLFRFDQFANEKMYDAIDSFDYSLRDIGIQMGIEIGTTFPAFAYILPYEKDGWKMWCAVDNSGEDVESWGKEFGIKHYLIFEMLFE